MARDNFSLPRREAIALLSAGAGVAITPTVAGAKGGRTRSVPPRAADTVLWYAQPATNWVEAVPVGNGRISAMVHGGIDHEYLQLNEDTFWAGGPYDPARGEAAEAMPEARRLVFAERFEEAVELISDKIMAKPLRQMSYGVAGSLIISRIGAPSAEPPVRSPSGLKSEVTPATSARPVAGYRRELDLDAAIARTRWREEGVKYRREVLASAPDQIIAIRMSADKAKSISVELSFSTPVKRYQVSIERNNELVLTSHGDSMHGVEGKLRCETRARVRAKGGRVDAKGDRIVVNGADELIILVALGTNYKRFDDVSGDPSATTRAQIDRVASKAFDRIAADATTDHRQLFRRVSIDLGFNSSSELPTDQRIRGGESGQDTSLAALYFNYARYMLIGCSRPGAQPANLQGIWNDTPNPPWGGKYTVNINTQMNYWPAESTNLPECVGPLVSMLRDLSVTGARTAKKMYGARGWVCHHNTDLWRATAPIDGVNFGMWPTGGAWLCTHLWDHYDYGRDRAFLESVYPIMKGAALFFVDTLVQDPKTGFMVTNPSISPENNHGLGGALCAGPTMDMAILRDLFEQTAEAARILGRDAGLARQMLALREKLAPYKIGAQGQLQEWQDDWDAGARDIHHRHVSHLYGVYPSAQISLEREPKLAAAARRSLEIRGDEATGWATAWRIALWARLRDGNHAHRILRFLIGPKRTYPNMFDAHPPFQIDGNFGGAAAIAEMLMSSAEDQILLLPALPDAWPNGSIRGLRARGGCAIDLSWAKGSLTEATIGSRIGGQHTVRCGEAVQTLDLKPGEQIRFVGPRLTRS